MDRRGQGPAVESFLVGSRRWIMTLLRTHHSIPQSVEHKRTRRNCGGVKAMEAWIEDRMWNGVVG